MRELLLLILVVFMVSGCKKAIEQAQENIILDAMTNGVWVVDEYLQAGTSIKNDFSPYRFQFKKNETVDAINNGNVEKTGTWQANPDARTITSNFSNASEPLSLLNGTWTITNTTWTSVDAERMEGSELRKLKLVKL